MDKSPSFKLITSFLSIVTSFLSIVTSFLSIVTSFLRMMLHARVTYTQVWQVSSANFQ